MIEDDNVCCGNIKPSWCPTLLYLFISWELCLFEENYLLFIDKICHDLACFIKQNVYLSECIFIENYKIFSNQQIHKFLLTIKISVGILSVQLSNLIVDFPLHPTLGWLFFLMFHTQVLDNLAEAFHKVDDQANLFHKELFKLTL